MSASLEKARKSHLLDDVVELCEEAADNLAAVEDQLPDDPHAAMTSLASCQKILWRVERRLNRIIEM